MNEKIISAQAIRKEYNGAEVLHDVDLHPEKGRFTLITGPSGSGKTTLLNIISGIDRPSSGEVTHEGVVVSSLDNKRLTRWRADHTGTIFQRSGLLGGLTARQNILAPHNLSRNPVPEGWLSGICDELAIDEILDRPASVLSGGEKQRVAIARALAHQPDLVFADEPTASLETHTKHQVHRILRSLVDKTGVSLVMVSHDDISKEYADNVVQMRDGAIR